VINKEFLKNGEDVIAKALKIEHAARKSKELNSFETAIKADAKIANEEYATHLYCAINNSGIYDLSDNLVADYVQRSCGGMIAHLRAVDGEDYIDFAWSTTKADLSYIHQDLERLGFKVGEHPSYRLDYQYQHPNWVKVGEPA